MPRREKPRLSLRRPPPADARSAPVAGPPTGTDPVEAFVEGAGETAGRAPPTIALSADLFRRLQQACTVEAMEVDTAVAEALAAWVEGEPPSRYDW